MCFLCSRGRDATFDWSWAGPDPSAALSIPPQVLQALAKHRNAAALSTCNKTGEGICISHCRDHMALKWSLVVFGAYNQTRSSDYINVCFNSSLFWAILLFVFKDSARIVFDNEPTQHQRRLQLWISVSFFSKVSTRVNAMMAQKLQSKKINRTLQTIFICPVLMRQKSYTSPRTKTLILYSSVSVIQNCCCH